MNYHKRNAAPEERGALPEVFVTDGTALKLTDRLKRHTAVEISMVEKGFGTCSTEHKSYNACEGDIFIFSPNELHSFEFNSDDYKILTIHTEPRCIWNVGPDFPDSELLGIFFERNDSFVNRIEASSDAAAQIRVLMHGALAEATDKGKEYAIALKVKIISILIILLRTAKHVRRAVHMSSRSYNLESLERTLRYIDENLTNPLDLDMLATAAHLSRSHLCTVFKRYNGISPWDYITIRRIEHSLTLLKSADKSKHEIALSCGFNNSANFYRAFSKVVKMTPNELIY